MSITEPIFSSLAGANPPNPVLAVRSGSLELELLPFKQFFITGDFFARLLVTSGIELNIILCCGSCASEGRGEANLLSPCVLTVRPALEAVLPVAAVLG